MKQTTQISEIRLLHLLKENKVRNSFVSMTVFRKPKELLKKSRLTFRDITRQFPNGIFKESTFVVTAGTSLSYKNKVNSILLRNDIEPTFEPQGINGFVWDVHNLQLRNKEGEIALRIYLNAHNRIDVKYVDSIGNELDKNLVKHFLPTKSKSVIKIDGEVMLDEDGTELEKPSVASVLIKHIKNITFGGTRYEILH